MSNSGSREKSWSVCGNVVKMALLAFLVMIGICGSEKSAQKKELTPAHHQKPTSVGYADSIESKIRVQLVNVIHRDSSLIDGILEGVTLRVQVTNESGMLVQGLKGDIAIKDAFNNDIGSFGIAIDEFVKPGEVKTLDLVYGIDALNQKDHELVRLQTWNAVFKAEKITIRT